MMQKKQKGKRIFPIQYFALADLDLTFFDAEVELFIKLWNEDANIAQIHDDLLNINKFRTLDEVLILTFDLGRKGRIEQRKNGILGNSNFHEREVRKNGKRKAFKGSKKD